MLKKFQIKTYTVGGTLKQTISPKIVMSDISFSSNINGGQGQLTLKLDDDFTTTKYGEGDLIKIREYDDDNKTGRQIYFGFISKVNRIQTTGTQEIDLTCIGIYGLLSNLIFYYSASFLPTINADPGNIIKDIIDYFNTKYAGSILSYSGGHIDLYGSSINISFNYTDCFNAILNVQKATNFRFYIDETGQVWFKAKPVSSTHLLTNKKNVEQLEVRDDFESLVNKYYLSRAGGVYQTYQDASSQSTYGLKEKKEDNSALQDASTQNTYGNNYIADNKDPKREIRITVNSFYDIESINPGDTVSVLNIDYSISNVQIMQTNYSVDKTLITLDKITTFGQMVVG